MAKYSNTRDYFQGKLGSLVYSSIHGTKYVKVFVPPSDPKTPAQQKVRTAFSNLAHIGKALYEIVLKPYTFPKPVKETAYNLFIHINKGTIGQTWSDANLKIFDGSLPSSAFSGLSYDTQSKKVKCTWSTTLIGIMKATDKAICVLIQNDVVVGYGISTRGAGSLEINPAEFQKIKSGVVNGYLVFAQEPTPGTHETGLTSTTAYKSITITGLREKDFDEIEE